MVKSHPARRRTAIVLVLAAVGLACGCVERRYTIRTDPPGAQVIVNGESLGPTPASHNFYYYGDREITLVLDGYETKTLIQPINAPWWDNYLTEFFTENLVPGSSATSGSSPTRWSRPARRRRRRSRACAEALRSEAQVLPPPRRGGHPRMASDSELGIARSPDRSRDVAGIDRCDVAAGNPRIRPDPAGPHGRSMRYGVPKRASLGTRRRP